MPEWTMPTDYEKHWEQIKELTQQRDAARADARDLRAKLEHANTTIDARLTQLENEMRVADAIRIENKIQTDRSVPILLSELDAARAEVAALTAEVAPLRELRESVSLGFPWPHPEGESPEALQRLARAIRSVVHSLSTSDAVTGAIVRCLLKPNDTNVRPNH